MFWSSLNQTWQKKEIGQACDSVLPVFRSIGHCTNVVLISGIYTIGIPPPTYEVKGIPPMYYEEAKGEKISSREAGEETKDAPGNTQM